MKALIGGREILFRWNCGVVATKEDYRIMFIPAKKVLQTECNQQKFHVGAHANCWVPPEKKTCLIS